MNNIINGKQRFKALCDNKILDRLPRDYLAHYRTNDRLMKHLNIHNEIELLDYLDCDFYYLPCRDISQREGFMKYYKGRKLWMNDTERECALGIKYKREVYDNKFSVDEAYCAPLKNASTIVEILNHDWPDARDFNFDMLIPECENNADRAIIGGLWTGIMGDAYRLVGFQKFLLNIALKPDFTKTLINRLTDMYLELNDAIFTSLKNKMDIWFFGNDFGSQNGLMISESMWCDFFKEPITKLCNLAHSYNLKVMMHSCGSIRTLIPHLIECGVDILDPIQVSANDMKLQKLKSYSKDIILHGGIDTQHLLPYATPQEVSKHCKNIKEMFSGGGYIFAPSQILGDDIPIENILAMYKL